MRRERAATMNQTPRIGYQHFIDPSRACLGLASRVFLAGASIGAMRVTQSVLISHHCIDLG